MGQFSANLLKSRCFLGCLRISFTLGLFLCLCDGLFCRIGRIAVGGRIKFLALHAKISQYSSELNKSRYLLV